MDTSRMTTRFVGAALAALALLPATAQAAALTPLKPCYVSVTNGGGQPPTQEPLNLAGNGFTPGSFIDIGFDGKLDRTVQADAAGNLTPQVLGSPYRPRGEGAFTL